MTVCNYVLRTARMQICLYLNTNMTRLNMHSTLFLDDGRHNGNKFHDEESISPFLQPLKVITDISGKFHQKTKNDLRHGIQEKEAINFTVVS